MIVNIDGNFVTQAEARIPVSDGGFLYGDTLFETIAIRDGRLHFRREHLERLHHAAQLCEFPCPHALINTALDAVLERFGTGTGRLRLTLSRGDYHGPARPSAAGGRVVVTASQATTDFSAERQIGIDCIAAPNRRVNPLAPLPQLKRGNYQDCLYALHHARRRGAFEALFVTQTGHLLEGATSNLFIVHNETLITPPPGELVLAGIVRSQVLRAAAELNVPCVEGAISVAALAGAREAFICNSLVGLLPIACWQGGALHRGTLHQQLSATIERYA